MLTIDENNNIYLSKGNSATIALTVKQGEETYDYTDDTVIFALKKYASDRDALIKKTFDSEGNISLTRDDTDALPIGTYAYDVTLVHEEDETTYIDTIITPHAFTIGAVIGEPEVQ